MSNPIIADNKPKKVGLEKGEDYTFCTCGASTNQPYESSTYGCFFRLYAIRLAILGSGSWRRRWPSVRWCRLLMSGPCQMRLCRGPTPRQPSPALSGGQSGRLFSPSRVSEPDHGCQSFPVTPCFQATNRSFPEIRRLLNSDQLRTMALLFKRVNYHVLA